MNLPLRQINKGTIMKKIGLIGYGTIGRYIYEKIVNEKNIEEVLLINEI